MITYTVRFTAYNGFSYAIIEREENRETVKQVVRDVLRSRRKRGCSVSKIGKGRWEVETSDDAFSVSDREGFLTIKRDRSRS